jgi:hypothetical protein
MSARLRTRIPTGAGPFCAPAWGRERDLTSRAEQTCTYLWCCGVQEFSPLAHVSFPALTAAWFWSNVADTSVAAFVQKPTSCGKTRKAWGAIERSLSNREPNKRLGSHFRTDVCVSIPNEDPKSPLSFDQIRPCFHGPYGPGGNW